MDFSKSGRSDEQRKAEKILRKAFSRETGVSIKERKFQFGKISLEVDGHSEKPPFLCEIWAHIGRPRSAQRDKIAKDTLKLIFLQKKLRRKFKKIIIFADREAQKPFTSQTWVTACLKEFNIKTKVIRLSRTDKKILLKAQKRQNMAKIR